MLPFWKKNFACKSASAHGILTLRLVFPDQQMIWGKKRQITISIWAVTRFFVSRYIRGIISLLVKTIEFSLGLLESTKGNFIPQLKQSKTLTPDSVSYRWRAKILFDELTTTLTPWGSGSMRIINRRDKIGWPLRRHYLRLIPWK